MDSTELFGRIRVLRSARLNRGTCRILFPSTVMVKKNKDVSGTMPEDNAANPQQIAPQDAKRRPIESIRIGDVSASIWARQHQVRGELKTFYSLTLERSYRDRTGAFQFTKSFDPDSLGSLVAVIQKADEYFHRLEQTLAEQDAA